MEKSKKRFGLSRNERIKSKKDFEKIFSSGEIFYSSDKKIRATYLIEQTPEFAGVKIAAAINKRFGIAAWRNRIKRIIKESFRLNKEILTLRCIEKNISLKIIFAFTLRSRDIKKPKLDDLMPSVAEVMHKIQKRL